MNFDQRVDITTPVGPIVESIARALCASEGSDPDGQMECDDDEVPGPVENWRGSINGAITLIEFLIAQANMQIQAAHHDSAVRVAEYLAEHPETAQAA